MLDDFTLPHAPGFVERLDPRKAPATARRRWNHERDSSLLSSVPPDANGVTTHSPPPSSETPIGERMFGCEGKGRRMYPASVSLTSG